MRRTLSALVAVVFLARFVAIAAAADYTLLGYDDRLPPPPPPASCTVHTDCEEATSAPVILQLGPPPVFYSPAADFIAHAQAAAGIASTDDHFAPATIYPTAVAGSFGAGFPTPPLPFAAPAPNVACIPPANVIYGPWIPAPYQPRLACVEPTATCYPDPATGMASMTADRLDHLLQAVDHLDAAGMPGEADQLRRVCTSDMRTVLAKYKSDQSELAQLRQQTRHEAALEPAPAACTPSQAESAGRKSVAVSVQFLEVNRTKMRNLGFDFSGGSPGESPLVVDSNSGFQSFVEALKREDIAKVLSAPKVITRSGEKAFLQIGQRVPLPKPQENGTVSFELKTVGTELWLSPVVLSGNKLQLEIQPRLSEFDRTLPPVEFQGIDVPAFKVREIHAVIEIESGQTAVFGGFESKREVVQTVERAANKKFDLMDVLRQVAKEEVTEVQDFQTLIIVRPEIIDEAACDEKCTSGSCDHCECGKCQCTHGECGRACNGSTTLVNPFAVEPAGCCSCGDAFGTSSCSDLFKLEPISLEPGKFLTPTITPQPYEIDPATFLKQAEHPDACFSGGFSR